MEGTRNRRAAPAILLTLCLVAGLFVSMSIVAAKMIWPDPDVFIADEIVAGIEEDADEAIQPIASVSDNPMQAIDGSAGNTVLSDTVPPRVAAISDAEARHSVFAVGEPVADSPVTQTVYDLGSRPEATTTPTSPDAEYEMDMRVAALARPVEHPAPILTPDDYFVLGNTSLPPSPDQVFSMADPQHPLHEAGIDIQIVSPEMDIPSTEYTALPQIAVDLDGPRRMAPATAPMNLNFAALSPALQLDMPLPASASDDDLVRDIAKVLAALPVPLVETPDEVAQPESAHAPFTSPRPRLRGNAPLNKGLTQPEYRVVEADPTMPPRLTEPDTITPTSAPAPAAILVPVPPTDGRSYVTVVGVHDTDGSAWALLEMNDGRIIKVTRGTELQNLKITRIRGDKVWVRNGTAEKGLIVGQFITFD